MEDYFNKNLKHFNISELIFKGIDPYCGNELVKTKDDHYTLVINDKYLHSLYNPIAEAKKLIDSYKIDECPIIIFGFGLGYHLFELGSKYPNRKVLIVEKNLQVLRTAFKLFDFTTLKIKVQFYFQHDVQNIISDSEFYNAIHNNPTIIVHRPSTMLNIQFYQNLTDSLLSIDKFTGSKKLRVLFVTPLMGGSVSIANYVQKAFKSLGVSLQVVDNTNQKATYDDINNISDPVEKSRAKETFFRFLTDSVEMQVNEFSPDLVFAVAQSPMSIRLLNNLSRKGIKTAFWFVENFRQLTYWNYMAAYYDYFFTIQEGEFFEELERKGVRNYYYMPLAAHPEYHAKSQVEMYKNELSFAGMGYGNRHKFFEELIRLDPTTPLKLWGHQWQESSPVFSRLQNGNQFMDIDKLMNVYASSKIVINLHSSINSDKAMPEGDKDFVNPRTFELASMGVFQLVDERDILSKYFEVGKEIITFNSVEDLISKYKYYLEHDMERHEIAMRARTRALREHTYCNRLTSILTRIFGVGVLKSLGAEDQKNVIEKNEMVRPEIGKKDDMHEASVTFGQELLQEEYKKIRDIK